jgi:hypothetical protein
MVEVSSQPTRSHSRSQLAAVPFIHCRRNAHLFAQCMDVYLTTQHIHSGVGVSQPIARSFLPILVFQQTFASHAPKKCAVQDEWLIAVTDTNNLWGTRSVSIVSNDNSQMSFWRACKRRSTSAAMCLAINQRPPVLPSAQIRM